jgi:DNA-binding HxlR family transcriptional regulator
MNYINQTILEQLRSGGKTAGELKDAVDCSYSVLDQALCELINASEIEPAWSNDDYPVRIYQLKRKYASIPFWRN